MFPLGSVLFPSGVLPLHVFEPRYQALVADVMAADGVFGVVLISRGSEVGGGEHRTSIGTVAEVREHESFDDGRSALIASGTTRFEVVGWLPDDPYPLAEVVELAELPFTDPATQALLAARAALDELLDTAVRSGRLDDKPDILLDNDAATAAWQLVDLSPIGALDRQQLLETIDPAERLALLKRFLDDLRHDFDHASDVDS